MLSLPLLPPSELTYIDNILPTLLAAIEKLASRLKNKEQIDDALEYLAIELVTAQKRNLKEEYSRLDSERREWLLDQVQARSDDLDIFD